jgi:hypothetical protein
MRLKRDLGEQRSQGFKLENRELLGMLMLEQLESAFQLST